MSFGLLTTLLILWLSWLAYRDYLSPKWRRKRARLLAKIVDLSNLCNEDKMKMNDKQNDLLYEEINQYHQKAKTKNTKISYWVNLENSFISFLTKNNFDNSIVKRRHGVRSFLITVIVILVLRNFFVMPFVIPTGSMQPTLHGINYYSFKQLEKKGKSVKKPVKIKRILEMLFYGRSYIQTPLFDYRSPSRVANPYEMVSNFLGIPFLQTFIVVEKKDKKIYFPGTLNTLRSAYNIEKLYNSKNFDGYTEMGDFLLVNRYSYYFSKPKRGDIIVFSTSSLSRFNKKLQGVFYIKRLIGLGGDIVRIDKNNQTWIKSSKSLSFVKLQEIAPKTKKIFSNNDDYMGHLLRNISGGIRKSSVINQQGIYEKVYIFEGQYFLKKGQRYTIDSKNRQWKNYYIKEGESGNRIYLLSGQEKFIFDRKSAQKYFLVSYENKNGYKIAFHNDYNDYSIPKGYFFALGDNSANSLDCRYIGVISQKELVGKPLFIFWPFSQRWGLANSN